MEEALLEVISRIVEEKKQSGVFPIYALSRDVYNDVAKTLNKLYSEGKIKVGKTLNDKWIEIVPKNDS